MCMCVRWGEGGKGGRPWHIGEVPDYIYLPYHPSSIMLIVTPNYNGAVNPGLDRITSDA